MCWYSEWQTSPDLAFCKVSRGLVTRHINFSSDDGTFLADHLRTSQRQREKQEKQLWGGVGLADRPRRWRFGWFGLPPLGCLPTSAVPGLRPLLGGPDGVEETAGSDKVTWPMQVRHSAGRATGEACKAEVSREVQCPVLKSRS